jgi:hypothetical protein
VAELHLVRSLLPIVRSKRLTALSVLLALGLIGAIVFAVSDSVRFVVCSTLGAILYGFPSDKDWADAKDIREKIRSVHRFT